MLVYGIIVILYLISRQTPTLLGDTAPLRGGGQPPSHTHTHTHTHPRWLLFLSWSVFYSNNLKILTCHLFKNLVFYLKGNWY